MQFASKFLGSLPTPLNMGFKKNAPDAFIPNTIEYVEVDHQQFVVGIENLHFAINPLRGRIIHLSLYPREFYAAMGRDVNGKIDYAHVDVINQLKQIIKQAFETSQEHQHVLQSISTLNGLTTDEQITLLAQCGGDANKVPEMILGSLKDSALPLEFGHAMAWFKSNIGGWRLRAYFQTARPFYWLLDCHRFGRNVYTRRGTMQNSNGIVVDEALWIPDESFFEEIENIAKSTERTRCDLSLQVLDTMLVKYNAYLKQQVFRVSMHRSIVNERERQFVEIWSSEHCYGMPAAQQEMANFLDQMSQVKVN